MRSMQWQLGILGTISAFAFRYRETKKNLRRGGRSQDLPDTDFQPAVWHLKYKKKGQDRPHSTTNTHKITTHTRQLQLYTRSTNNNYTKYNLKLETKHTRQIRIKHVQKAQHPSKRAVCTVSCNCFFLQSLIHSLFHPSTSLLFTYYSYKPSP